MEAIAVLIVAFAFISILFRLTNQRYSGPGEAADIRNTAEHGKPVSPSVIKTEVGLAKSNVTLACGKLVMEGFITKSHDNFDIREVTYSLTDAGQEYLNDFLTIAKKNFEGQLAYKNNMKQIDEAVEDLLSLVK